MEDIADDQEDSAIETESNCSYEETAAKIEMVLRRNLRLDMVDGNDDRQTTQPSVGESSPSSLLWCNISLALVVVLMSRLPTCYDRETARRLLQYSIG